MQNLNNLLKILLDQKIDFVLIGGYAGVVYGATQVTRDIDICGLVTPKNVSKLREALKDLHPRHRMNPGHKPSFLEAPKNLNGVNNIYLETDLGVLDIVNHVTGVGDFQRVRDRAREISLFGHKCKVISIEDLIKAKETLGRAKDLATAKELRAILDLKKQ